jgi:hypothetical protein
MGADVQGFSRLRGREMFRNSCHTKDLNEKSGCPVKSEKTPKETVDIPQDDGMMTVRREQSTTRLG